MRKLLLTTTAMVGAMALSAAHADVSISGAMEFTYQNHDSGIAATSGTSVSGDEFASDQNIVIAFTNKTDSGLTIGMVANIESDGAGASSTYDSDENYITISGGFGKLELGNQDGVGDQLTTTAHDLMGPDALNDGNSMALFAPDHANGLVADNADLVQDINDQNSINYTLPKMGGLTIGVGYQDNGDTAALNGDETVIAAKYEFESGAVKGSIHYGSLTKDGASFGDRSLNSSSMGVKIASGPFTAIIAQAKSDSGEQALSAALPSGVEGEVNDYGVSYNVGNGLTLSVVGTEVTESSGGESLDVTSVSAKYNIASGLDAYLTMHDYDYKAGTSGQTADDGSLTAVTIRASF